MKTETIQTEILALHEICDNLAADFCVWLNAMEAEVSEDGNVSYTLQSDGYGWIWATDEQLKEFAEWIKSI
ncbi:MAG: hypothetical protein AB7E32_14125 [Desulfovibrio sp.]